ncbi:MAG TPA: DUF5606 domain-containing protein [Mucilaginibacter sp.]|jgi:hypothetical protein|nr:DUF5606 domain-containing protein [Mucilaginibacter sp.]
MNLLGIVSVSGKPGLWKALAQNKTGYILESLDAQKTKMVANLSTAKIAALNEITLFGEEEDIRLTDVFERMKKAGSIPEAKTDGPALRRFFREVAPDHDEEKVYASDMKKVIGWYNILKELPLFDEAEPGAIPAEAVQKVDESPVVEAPAKPEAGKAPTKTKAKMPAAKKA